MTVVSLLVSTLLFNYMLNMIARAYHGCRASGGLYGAHCALLPSPGELLYDIKKCEIRKVL